MGRRTATIVWTAKIHKFAGSDDANARIVEIKDSRYTDVYVFEISTEVDSLGVAIWRKMEVSTLGCDRILDMILGRVGAKVEAVAASAPLENTGGF